MSWFGSEVIKIEKMEKHPNGDHLSLVRIHKPIQATLVVRTSDWAEGQLAAYVMPDSIASDAPEFAFLGEKKRIKATKLRGIVSMGLLVPARPHWKEGDNVTEELGLKKYDDSLDNPKVQKDLQAGPSPSGSVTYTDIESLRRYPNVFKEGEEVILEEKCHGASARFVQQNNVLYCGSHKRWLKEGNNDWWNVAFKYGLPEILPKYEDKIFFGEVYGQVQDLKYGAQKGEKFLSFFDIFDIHQGKYLDWENTQEILKEAGLTPMPLLYKGPWLGYDEMVTYAGGSSLLDKTGKTDFKEGFVVRPIKEAFDEEIGRKILKFHSERFLSR